MTSERFNKAYNALVQAFFEGTLAKGTCRACAVGNIVADAMGGRIYSEGISYECTVNNSFWMELFITSDPFKAGKIEQRITIENNPELAEILKELTAYSAEELAKVEYVFEINTKIPYLFYSIRTQQQEILEDQYNGLVAVVDVLLSFEEEQTDATPYKNKFREHPQLS